MRRNLLTLLLGVLSQLMSRTSALLGFCAFLICWALGTAVLRVTGSSEVGSVVGLGLILISPFAGGFVCTSVLRHSKTLPLAVGPILFGAVWIAWSWGLVLLGRNHADVPDHWLFHIFRGSIAAFACWLGCVSGRAFASTQGNLNGRGHSQQKSGHILYTWRMPWMNTSPSKQRQQLYRDYAGGQ
jgi:hypothetical protein